MKTAALVLYSLLILLLTAFGLKDGPTLWPIDPSSYRGDIRGAVSVSTRGEARFGVIDASDGNPGVFTLSLGANGAESSVLFTRTSGAALVPGTYSVGGHNQNPDEVQALIVAGTATHPTGVFWGTSGSLIISYARDNMIRGRFQVEGSGFLRSNPDDENQPIRATGTFTATRS